MAPPVLWKLPVQNKMLVLAAQRKHLFIDRRDSTAGLNLQQRACSWRIWKRSYLPILPHCCNFYYANILNYFTANHIRDKHFSWQKSAIALSKTAVLPQISRLSYQHRVSFKSQEAHVLRRILSAAQITQGETNKPTTKEKLQTWLPSLRKYLFSMTWEKQRMMLSHA